MAEAAAHAALVFAGDDAIAWCEYGSPLELPDILHRKEYDASVTRPAPWRITRFFVDRDHRRSEVAREALDGALELIAQAGGGESVRCRGGDGGHAAVRTAEARRRRLARASPVLRW